MLSYEALPGDVDHMIADDHAIVERQFQHLEAGRGERRVLVDQIVFELSLHATAEERVVYPALRDAGLRTEADDAIDEHQQAKEFLAVLQSKDPGGRQFEAALRGLIAEIRHHVHDEERQLLPALRSAVGSARMAELGQKFLDAKRSAPTFSHPHGPSSGAGHAIADAAAKLVDTVRDKASGRKPRLATDGSGLLNGQAQAILDAFSELEPKPIEILTPEQARRQPGPDTAVKKLMEARDIDGPEPVGGVEELTIPDAAGGLQTLRVYRPMGSTTTPLPVIMWIHGGGWVLFDLDTYDASCRGLCNKTGAIVVSPDYRRAPEAVFPASHDDVLKAWRWLRVNAGSIGADATRMGIGGESVGGTMAAATCLQLAEAGEPLPSAVACVYPLTTAAEFGDSMSDAADARPLNKAVLSWMAMHAFEGVPEAADDWRVDLLSVPAERLSVMPPTMVLVDERDPLRSQGEEFARHLSTAGVDVVFTRYDGVMHEFFGAAAVLDEAEHAQREVADLFTDSFGSVPSMV